MREASPHTGASGASQKLPAPQAKFEAWIEGSRGDAAELDSGIQLHGLKILYWRVHKVGWFRVRVVFGVRGPTARVRAFQRAFHRWTSPSS